MAALERLTDDRSAPPDASPHAPASRAFPAWQGFLAARRGEVNRTLAGARSAGAPAELLSAALRELGGPVEMLAAALPADAFDAVVRRLVDLVCDLAIAKLWHERSAERWAMLELVPQMPRAVARSPHATLDVLVHGAGRIARRTDLAAWAARLTAADPHLPDDAALRAGAAVAAWRSGLVRGRRSAIQAAQQLDDDALRAVLGLDAAQPVDPRAALAESLRHPFAWPGRPGTGLVATLGGFRGFGGPWAGLPVVAAALPARTPTWLVRADGVAWVVVADAHGHEIFRRPRDHDAAGTSGRPRLDLAKQVAPSIPWEDTVTGLALAEPAPGEDAERASRPVLVSRATSYRLDLVVLPPPAGEATAP